MVQRWVALKIIFGLATLAAVTAPTPATARPPTETSCETISKPEVVTLFDNWNRALLTKRAEAVVAEYAADATLLPTVQNGPLVGSEAIGKYFAYFLKKSPQATVETRVILTGCNFAYDSGLYTFMVDAEKPGMHEQVKARFTFIYVPIHGKWLIIHHHSSADPVLGAP